MSSSYPRLAEGNERLRLTVGAGSSGDEPLGEAIACRAAVDWLSPVELTRASWRHSVSEQGRTETEIGGLAPPDIVLNRLGGLTLPAPVGWSRADAEYASAECRALLVSWLMGLGSKVVDPPGGSHLAGSHADPWAERRGALACGLALQPALSSVDERHPGRSVARARLVLVIGNNCAGAPESLVGLCLAFARMLGLDTLRIELIESQAGWGYAACERLPPLDVPPALDALLDLLETRAL